MICRERVGRHRGKLVGGGMILSLRRPRVALHGVMRTHPDSVALSHPELHVLKIESNEILKNTKFGELFLKFLEHSRLGHSRIHVLFHLPKYSAHKK